MLSLFTIIENRIRRWFSHRPIFYGFSAGVGIVLFWRGVWHTMDMIMMHVTHWRFGSEMDFTGYLWWDGPLSLSLGFLILLFTGVYVSSLIGNEVILSGLRGEKQLTEMTERELKTEAGAIAKLQRTLDDLKDHIKKH